MIKVWWQKCLALSVSESNIYFDTQAKHLEDEVKTLDKKLTEAERKHSTHTDFLLSEMKRQREELDVLRAEKLDVLMENKRLRAVSKSQKVKEFVGGGTLLI